LLQVTGTTGAARVFSGTGENGEQNRSQYCYDGNNDQEFNECKASVSAATGACLHFHKILLSCGENLMLQQKRALKILTNYMFPVARLSK
jgi:hypothetical protein